MRFEFTSVIQGATCHIRDYGEGMLHNKSLGYDPHKHHFMEFQCVFSGEVTICLPNSQQEIRVKPGQILMLPPGIYHYVIHTDTAAQRLAFNFSVDPDGQKSNTIRELVVNNQEVLLFEDQNTAFLAEQYRTLESQQDRPLIKERLGLLLLSTVLQLLSNTSSAQILYAQQDTQGKQQKWIIEDYIDKHFKDDDGIEGLANALHLSQRQTRTLVKRFLGTDYKTVIIRRRMELAEIYLQNPKKTLEEIAWQVGYRSYSGFQLCFKRYFGITPSEMRRQLTK